MQKNNSVLHEEIHQKLLTNVTSTPEAAKRFFKTAPGSYGEQDQFLGITVPAVRKVAKQFSTCPRDVLQQVLASDFNEERLLALLILVDQYAKATAEEQEQIYNFYLQNLRYVNNWNLVDSSAHLIVGRHLWGRDRAILERFVYSNDLWERRVGIVATWYFIRRADLDTTFYLASLLLSDTHDLIHKAVGWMLREAGKCDQERLIAFLSSHGAVMPRTMLRYAIERLDKATKVQLMGLKQSLRIT